MSLQLLYGAALFGVSAQAFAFLPRPTAPFEARPLENGWSPAPTPAPDAALFRRQISLPSTYLIAPDNTCGFINGNSKSPYACVNEDEKCAFIPSSGKVPGAAGCCKGKDCSFRISCVDRSDMDDCNDACQSDALTLKCTGAARFCNTIAFPGGVTDYYCSAKRTSVLKAQTTHSGDKSRSMSSVTPTTSSTTKKSTSSTSSKTSSASSTSESSTETASEASSDVPASSTEPPPTSSTDADRASAATSSTDPVASDAPATPVGAIVGGVLGGIALIALAIFGAVFLRQHKKKSMAMAELPPPQPFMAEPTFPRTQPPAASYGQDSSSYRMSDYPTSAAATPAHMYATPAAAASGVGVGVGAGAAAAAAFSAYHNSHNNHPTHQNSSYHDPSPMTTPGGSPQPQYAHQPHAPPPLPAPSYYNHSPHSSQSHHHHHPSGNDGAWAGAASTMVVESDPPDRRSTSTPVSTYNGTTPVSPASALGPMPGEPQHQHGGGSGGSGGMGGVPLILQPGMGYRPYRPGGNTASAGGSIGSTGAGGGSVMSVPRKAVSGSSSPSPPPPSGQGQGQGQSPPAAGQGGGDQQHQHTAFELP